MFLETKNHWIPPERPDRPAPRLSPRGARVLSWLVGFNLLMLLVAPIAGVTFIDVLRSLLAGG